MIYGTICCLGDSLTRGARCHIGYPELLPGYLHSKKTEWAVLNRGISGQTTWQILDRTPAAIRELAGLAGAKWCVILAGTNDSKSDGKLPHTDWEILYRQILHWPRRYEIPITLCTLPRIGWPDMPCFSEKSMAWIATANERIRAMRIELDNKPSPVRLCDLEDIGDPYLIDGVHLTEAGYRMLAERIAAVLEV